MPPPLLQPTPLEVACGTVFGWSPPEPLPDVPASLTPLEALEDAIAAALERGRCFVAFSGGRDSSAILAVALRVARQRGLDDPVAVTLRFPGDELSDEDAWQEEVVADLGATEWDRVELGDELDLLGPLARSLVRRHGVWWPPNAHAYAPLAEVARGGTLLTGMDGDGLLGGWQWRRAAAVLAGRRRPAPRDVLRIAKARAPRPLRRLAIARGERPFDLPWLTAAAARAANAGFASQRAREPASWRRRLERYYLGQRHLAVIAAAIGTAASERGAQLLHPLMDRRFLAALARAGGRAGYESRTAAMTELYGSLLAPRIITRVSKADFTWAFWGPESRRFAAEWTGEGVQRALVDPEALRAAWLAPKPDIRSAMLLQAAWRAGSAAEREQRVDRVAE